MQTAHSYSLAFLFRELGAGFQVDGAEGSGGRADIDIGVPELGGRSREGPARKLGVGSVSSCRSGTNHLWGAAGVSLPGWAKARSSHPPTSTEGPLPLRSEPRAQTQSLTTKNSRQSPASVSISCPACLPHLHPSTHAPGAPQPPWLPGAWARTLPTTGPLHLLAPFFPLLRSQLGGHLPRQIFSVKESPVPRPCHSPSLSL